MITTGFGAETFSVTDCASFDEALKFVERGIYDRKLHLDSLNTSGLGSSLASGGVQSDRNGTGPNQAAGIKPPHNIPGASSGS